MIQLENYNGDTNYNLLEDDDIVNTLTSTATNKALSANQGKILNEEIVEVNTDITNLQKITDHTVNTVQELNYKCLGKTFVRKTIQFTSQSTRSNIDITDIFSNFKDNADHTAMVFIGSEGFARWRDSHNWYGTEPVQYYNGSKNYTFIQFSPKSDQTGYEVQIYRGEASRHDITFDVYCATENLE